MSFSTSESHGRRKGPERRPLPGVAAEYKPTCLTGFPKRGLLLVETGSGNFEVRTYPGLIVMDGYWRWPDRDLAGNAIDFCTQVLHLSFHVALRELLEV